MNEPHSQDQDLIKFFELSSLEIQSLREVFHDSPWWTRLWCVQELVHAQEAILIAGNQTLAWEKLPSAIRVRQVTNVPGLGNLFDIFASNQAILIARDILEHGIDDELMTFQSFLSLLRYFRNRSCSEPRDRIYALLSLSKKAQSTIKPDYRKSLSALCLEVTRFSILECKNREILCTYEYENIDDRQFITFMEAATKIGKAFENNSEVFKSMEFGDDEMIGGDAFPQWQGEITFEEFASSINQFELAEDSFLSRAEEMIPSWVPNMCMPPFTYSMTHYKAFGGETEIDMDIFDIKFSWLLKLNAVIFDSIAETSPRIDMEKNDWKWVIRDWKSKFCLQTEYPTKENTITVFWSTMIGNRSLRLGGGFPTATELSQIAAIMSSWCQASTDPNWRFEAKHPLASRIFELVSETLTGRRLCLTEKGYLGVVGGSSQPKDVVCIAQGAPAPMVLREHDCFRQEARQKGIELGEKFASAKFFTQAGVGYIHGIMDGEAMKSSEGRDVNMERVFLV